MPNNDEVREALIAVLVQRSAGSVEALADVLGVKIVKGNTWPIGAARIADALLAARPVVTDNGGGIING